MRRPQALIVLSCLLLMAQLVGCGGKTSSVNYYSLQASPPQVNTRLEQPLQVTVGVGPIHLPQLLKRPHLVTRSDTYQVKHAEFDRWSGDLQEEIVQTLANNLSRQLGTEQVIIYPWPNRFSPDWQVRVDIQRLDGELGNAAHLEARWALSKISQELMLTGFSLYEEKIEGPGYEALVAAESRLLETFSQELAAKIRSRN